MKLKVARLVLLLVGLGLLYAVWRLWLTRDVNRRLAAIRAAGLPTNGQELNQWYPAVPDKDNCALVLTQAFALRRKYSDSRSEQVWDLKLPRGNQPLSPAQTELLRDYVEMNAAALGKADEALKLPACRYPIDFSLLARTPLPHLAELQALIVLHRYRAELAIQSGDKESTSKAVETMLALARTLDHEPCLISQLVRVKLLEEAVATLARRVNAGALGSAEITNLVAAFGQTQATNLVARGLIGDRAMFAPYFRMSKKEAARLAPPHEDDEDGEGASLLPCKGPFILRLAGFYELDFRYFLAAMQGGIDLAGRPPPANLATVGHFARAGEVAAKGYRTVSGTILSSFAGVVTREDDGVAYHRVATTALAVERFRNERGRLPEELDELAPALLAEVPRDPFTGTDLLYRQTEKGYIIYSVGPDRKDDGGLDESEKKRSADGKSYDLCFAVER